MIFLHFDCHLHPFNPSHNLTTSFSQAQLYLFLFVCFLCVSIYIYIYIHFLLKFEKRAFHSPFLICVITLSGHGLRVLWGPSGKLVCIFLNALVSLLVHCPRLDVLSVWLSDLTATLSIIKRYDMSTVCYQHVSVTHSEDEHFGDVHEAAVHSTS